MISGKQEEDEEDWFLKWIFSDLGLEREIWERRREFKRGGRGRTETEERKGKKRENLGSELSFEDQIGGF